MKPFLIPMLVLSFLWIAGPPLFAQKSDTVSSSGSEIKGSLRPYHRNTIKFNPTPMLIQAIEIRNITIGYERMISNTSSLNIQAGYLIFPRLFNDTIASVAKITGREKYGTNLAVSYRYYPWQRNRRPAPDGMYIGGYISYYGYRFSNSLMILNTSVDPNGSIAGKFNILNMGVELGYQFIFWKRLSVDLLLFGPAISVVQREITLKGDLNMDEIENIDQETIDKLIAKFPFLRTLFSGEEMKFKGTKTSVGFGFRYCIQLGFHF